MSSPTSPRTPWTRGDRIGAASLVVTILAILLALTQPEVRHFIGLDHSYPTPSPSATNPTGGPVSALHIAYRANDASNSLYVTSSSDGVNWQTPARKQSQVQFQGSPTMAAFGGKLYIAFRSNNTASNLLYVTSSSDGQTWQTATQFGLTIQGSPAIAMF